MKLQTHLVTSLFALTLIAGCSRQPPAQAEAPAESAPAPVAEAPTPAAPAVPEDRVTVSAGVAKAGTVNAPDSGLVVVQYADLAQHVGARVELTTTMGSVRRGTVLTANNFETQLKLDPADGGFQLALPADTVAQIRLLPAETTDAGASAAK